MLDFTLENLSIVLHNLFQVIIDRHYNNHREPVRAIEAG